MSEITFEQIEAQYAKNPARQAVLKELREEIDYWKQTTTALRAWVFGQFFGIVEEPDKVQVLISAVLKPPDPSLPRNVRRDRVQVYRRMGPALVSKEEMIRTFNMHPQNQEEGITLRPEQVKELKLGDAPAAPAAPAPPAA